jgi:flagellar biosynthetic protein FliR
MQAISDAMVLLLLKQAWVFLCVVCRIGPLLLMIPPIRGQSLPVQIRLMLVLVLALCVTPSAASTVARMPDALPAAIIQLPLEMCLGLLLGTASAIIVTSLQIGASVVASLAGLDSSSSQDPLTDEQSPVLGQLLSWLSIALFLGFGAHRYLIQLCLASFQSHPVGGVGYNQAWLMQLVELVQHGLEFGIQASLPIALSLILANLLTGLVARTLPQVNMMVVGYNLNVLVLLATLVVSIGGVGLVFQDELVQLLSRTSQLVLGAGSHG